MFFQYLLIGENGRVASHYDAGIEGYITYKCNLYVQGPDDEINVGKESIKIQELDLYCFEANFYRHWINKCAEPRIHLSYGFIVPYEDLNWDKDDPRVRLANRITKAYRAKS